MEKKPKDPAAPDMFRNEDVQEAYDKLRTFWERYGNSLMITISLAAIIFAATTLVSNQRKSAHEQRWLDYAQADNPDALRIVANDYADDPAIPAMALDQAIDLQLNEYRNLNLEEEQRLEALEQAAKDAETLLAIEGLHDVRRAEALMQQATIFENQGNFEGAEENYNEIVTLTETTQQYQLQAEAQAKLDYLPLTSVPVVFAEAEVEEVPLEEDASETDVDAEETVEDETVVEENNEDAS